MRLRHACAVCVVASVGCTPPPPATNTPPAAAPSEPTLPERRIVVDLGEGPVPWTHLDVRDSEDTFQFAIVSDRTGGERPGVFASAVRRLNLLQPEFVMSVGDLIEGYTEDRERLKREWDEFDALVAGLEAPFFYLPGNHDITNQTMRELWHERYGPSRYAFVYKNVLFVCLDAMDGGLHQISQEQVQWLEHTLKTHAGVHWTLLFMHSPFWDAEPGEGTPTWDQVEAVLGKRNYTAFAGHYHRYMKHVRNDHRLITLATTGGGSSLRGPRYGEFDHIAWVTMSPSGPRIANLMLDGIWDENVRTEAIREFQSMLLGGSLHPTPIFFAGTFAEGFSDLKLVNSEDFAYDVKFSLEPPPGLSTPDADFELSIAPNSVEERRLQIAAEKKTEGANSIPVHWRASATMEGQEITFDGHTAIGLVNLLSARRRTPTVDGDLGDWGRLRFDVATPAHVLKQAEAWRGVDDARFSVDVSFDDDFIYVAVDVVDDSVGAEEGTPPWEQDGVEIRIDARLDPQRSHFGAARDGRDVALLALSPGQQKTEGWIHRAGWITLPDGVKASCVTNVNGYAAEVAIPRAWANSQAGGEAARIRVNVAVNDRDADGQAQLWWWPDWRSSAQIPGSGTFELQH